MYTYHRKPVTIPAEPSVHVVAALVRPARHDVLHRPREDVTVVRQTRSERGPIVKYVSVKQKQVTRKRCIYETKFQCTRKPFSWRPTVRLPISVCPPPQRIGTLLLHGPVQTYRIHLPSPPPPH